MAILYPPIIEGVLPAFCKTDKGATIVVPFAMNPAVSKAEVSAIKLKIKTVQSSTYLFELTSNELFMDKKSQAYFEIEGSDLSSLTPGQSYKVQIAYIDNNGDIGYYSTVGVIKYTNTPTVEIANLNRNNINNNLYTYTGVYKQEGLFADQTEKVYSYKFLIKDNKGNIMYEEEGIHNTSTDTEPAQSEDSFRVPVTLEENKIYYLQYVITTINNLVAHSAEYQIIQRRCLAPDVLINVHANLNFDNGYTKITFSSNKKCNGVFLLQRAESTDGYQRWSDLARVTIYNQAPTGLEYRDFSIEQGKTYKYSLQQYNEQGMYSQRMLSNELFADFEDAFLYDGEKQLKLRFNPKISSFKTDLLETKIDTIGSKYPFIFRNGNVEYKEFPISGLISYLMDEENLFMTDEELGLSHDQLDTDRVRGTQLSGNNMVAERKFKLTVLDWLNNGQPKLFRSPGEGNYLVRLMNTSLSPQDPLGRMLHTFNSNAYEIDKYSFDTLIDYGIVHFEDIKTTQTQVRQMDLSKVVLGQNLFRGIRPTWFSLEFVKLEGENYVPFELDGQQIFAMIEPNPQNPVIKYSAYNEGTFYSLKLLKDRNYTNCFLNYSYDQDIITTYNYIINSEVENVPARQFIGAYDDILAQIQDVKHNIAYFSYLRFRARALFQTDERVIDAKALDMYYSYKDTWTLNGRTYYNFRILDPKNLTSTERRKEINIRLDNNTLYVSTRLKPVVVSALTYKSGLFYIITSAGLILDKSGKYDSNTQYLSPYKNPMSGRGDYNDFSYLRVNEDVLYALPTDYDIFFRDRKYYERIAFVEYYDPRDGMIYIDKEGLDSITRDLNQYDKGEKDKLISYNSNMYINGEAYDALSEHFNNQFKQTFEKENDNYGTLNLVGTDAQSMNDYSWKSYDGEFVFDSLAQSPFVYSEMGYESEVVTYGVELESETLRLNNLKEEFNHTFEEDGNGNDTDTKLQAYNDYYKNLIKHLEIRLKNIELGE